MTGNKVEREKSSKKTSASRSATPKTIDPETKTKTTTKSTTKVPKKLDLGMSEVRKELHSEHNSRGRGRSAAEIRESYSKYNERKKKVLDFEATNTGFLALFAASDKDVNKEHRFYNMGGNSAIIYVHEIGPRIGRSPVLRRDMDNGKDNLKFHSGVCSIVDVDALEKKLAEIGILRAPTKDPDFVLFKLHREYPHSEIKAMLKFEQERLDNLNRVLYSKVLYPDIHRQIIELKKLVPAKVKNMDKTYRDIVGMEMVRSLMVIVRAYTEMAHGDADELESARVILKEADMMLAEISLFNELKLWEVSTCIRLGDIIAGLRKLVKGRIIGKYENHK